MKTLSPKERVLKLLQRRNARLKFKEIRDQAKLSNKETELVIAEIRKTRNDLVYAKFDKTFYFSDVVTHYSNQTDLSQVMPLEGQFGFISDTHLGSIGERLDLMKWAYDTFAERGIKQVFHTGD